MCYYSYEPLQWLNKIERSISVKLNVDCMRDILLTMENYGYGEVSNIETLHNALPNYTEEEISYACLKMNEAGFIDVLSADTTESLIPIIVQVTDITYDGHQFLENIRQQNVWNKTIETAKKLGSLSIPVLQEISQKIIFSMINNIL